MTKPKAGPKGSMALLLALALGAALVAGGLGIGNLLASQDANPAFAPSATDTGSAKKDQGAGELSQGALEEELQKTLDSVTLGELDGEAQKTLASVLDHAATVESSQLEGDVPEVATKVLEDYQSAGNQLAYASYLDGLGRAWGCVVQGEGWVESCVVQQGSDASKSLVEVVRFDRERWRETFG